MRNFLLFIPLYTLSFTIYAQSSWLDNSFDNDGVVLTTSAGPNMVNGGVDIEIQTDQKIVVLASSQDGTGGEDIMLIRYLADGSLDPSFGTSGIVITDLITNDIPKEVKIQSDGKIVVLSNSHLLRYNTDGTLDLSFDSDGWIDFGSYEGGSIGLLSNGKIGVATVFSDWFGPYFNLRISLYNANGSLHSNADFNIGSYIDISGLYVQSNDNVVVSGYNGGVYTYMYCIDSNGIINNSYGPNGNGTDQLSWQVTEMFGGTILPDDKILLTDGFNVWRILANGGLDLSFGTGGVQNTGWSNELLDLQPHQDNTDIIVQNDGKIIIVQGNGDYRLIRLNADGTTDTNYGVNGVVSIDVAGLNQPDITRAIAIQNDGKYVITGIADLYIGTIRVNSSCTVTHTEYISACGSYTWLNGGTYTASDNTGNYTFTNATAAGCDSIVNLDLTITGLNDYNVSINNGSHVCIGADTLVLSGSDLGVDYFIRDNSNDSIILGPISGTGGSLDIPISSVTSTTTYNVMARGYRPSYAYDFNGVDKHIELPDMSASLNTDSITTEAWINIDNYGANGQLIPIISGILGVPGVTFSMHLSVSASTATMNAGFYDGSWHVASYPAPPLGQWTHIAATYDKNNIRLFYDGVEVANLAESSPLPVYNQGWRIARRWDMPDYFDGKIDNLRIWNTARTEEEIAENAASCNLSSPNLVAQYQFEEGAYFTAIDDISGIYHGTPVNLDLGLDKVDGVYCPTCELELSQLGTINISSPASSTDVHTACGSFTWIDGITYTSSNNSATHILTSTGGCDSLVTLDLTINNPDTSVSLNGINITSNSSGAIYQWLDCDNAYLAISGESGQSFTASSNGNYAVAVTQNGCTDTSACYTINTIGIDPNYGLRSAKLYPNPTNNSFTLDVNQHLQGTVLRVMSLDGKLIHEERLHNNSTTVITSNWSKGLYKVLLINSEGISTYQIIKQ